jgi:predicted cupin superfamily sugar epimerase
MPDQRTGSDENPGPAERSSLSAAQIIELLELEPHPEGGHFRETFRDQTIESERSTSTAIYYLLGEGEVSREHRVDASEAWHWYAGAALELRIALPDETQPSTAVLGADIQAGQQPQIIVPKDHWQSARSLGAWTLVGCTVAPGFEFSGFEMAPDGWEPSGET